MSALPITRIVLYKHGVGAFEREARLHGSQVFDLVFKQDDVSDVLKSLTTIDLDGGHIRAIAYDSTKPIEQMLAEVAIKIPESNSLIALLPQLKGASVSVTPQGAAPLQGSLIGIDVIQEKIEGGVRGKWMVSLVTEAAEVHTFDLFQSSIILHDAGLQEDLKYYLQTSLAGKRKESRNFQFQAEGEGERRIVINYVTNAPVWKATYRMILGEGEQPLLQGWAVVDNVQEEDWENVELSLVAGLPVSFRHDLYTPRYVTRPEVMVEETSGVLPPQLAEGIVRDNIPNLEMERIEPEMRRMKYAAPCEERMHIGGAASGASSRSSMSVQVRERQLGELFEYKIAYPVSIRRNQSALVPIVQKGFEGEPVLYYQKAARAQNPLRAVEFKNTTGLTLEGGPVTVFSQGSYAGEAMLETTLPNDMKLVAYAVELGVRVTDSIDFKRGAFSSVIMANGVATSQQHMVEITFYTVQSKLDRDEVIYIEHPRKQKEWRLRDESHLLEMTENTYRLRFTLPAGKTSAFKVEEIALDKEEVSLTTASSYQLMDYVNSSLMSASVKKSLEEVVQERQRLAAIEQSIETLTKEEAKSVAQQKRIRENLSALADRTSEKALRDRYVGMLNQQEDELEKSQRERSSLQAQLTEGKERLFKLLMGLKFEAKESG